MPQGRRSRQQPALRALAPVPASGPAPADAAAVGSAARPRLVVQEVAFDAAEAVALREAMSAEMRLRYWDRTVAGTNLVTGMDVAPGEALWTAVVLDGRFPVGHAVLRRPWTGEDGAVEVKRMYVVPSHRGAGVATTLLAGVESAARALGARRIVLQTGDRQPDAVRLYENAGFRPVPTFTPYEPLSHSRCFAKTLPAVRELPRD